VQYLLLLVQHLLSGLFHQCAIQKVLFPLAREHISCRFSNIETIKYTCFCARCAPQYNFDPHSFQWCVGAITPRCSMNRRLLPKPDSRQSWEKRIHILDTSLETFHFDVRSLTPAARYERIKSKLRRYVLIEVCKCSFRSSSFRALSLEEKFSYVIIQRLGVHIYVHFNRTQNRHDVSFCYQVIDFRPLLSAHNVKQRECVAGGITLMGY
jgi:hypothetical protein